MNTEHDEQLSSLYKQARQDMPAAHLDEAILAAARRETASRPRPAYAPFSGSWRVPAALAAVLVLSVGLVNLMEHEAIPVNGYEPFAMDEADKLALNEEKQERAMAAKPAMTSIAEPEERIANNGTTSQLALQESLPAPVAQSPAVAAAVDSTDSSRLADQAIQEQSARKEKPQALAKAMSAKPKQLTAGAIAPLPTVDEISALRLAGKVPQANQAADAFIRHHFGEDLDKIDADKVTLPVQEQETFITELRLLGREAQADKLQGLMSGR